MRRHYFVDYEVYSFGQAISFGQFAFTWRAEGDEPFVPDDFLQRLRQHAADRHGVEAGEIRIRGLTRM